MGCSTFDGIEKINDRAHKVERRKFLNVVYSKKIELIKSKDELDAESLAEIEKIKRKADNMVRTAEAKALASQHEADEREVSYGSYFKIVGFLLLAVGVVGHFMVAYPALKSISSTAAGIGVSLVLAGIGLKGSVTVEDWMQLGLLILLAVIAIPYLFYRRNKGLDKWSFDKIKDFLKTKLAD